MPSITILSEHLLAVLLKGDMYAETHIPLWVGDIIKQYSPEFIVLERESEAQQFYTVYSPEGYANELKRREYIKQFDTLPKVTPAIVPKLTRAEILQQIEAAALKQDFEAFSKLQEQLKETT